MQQATRTKVLILIGPPGSGKSTWADSLPGDTVSVSADDYFLGEDGKYRYDPTRVGDAHAACLRSFSRRLQSRYSCTLVVDNTNLSVLDMAPYIRLAQAYCVCVEAHAFFGRYPNSHGVPDDKVAAMWTKFKQLMEAEDARYGDRHVLRSFQIPLFKH